MMTPEKAAFIRSLEDSQGNVEIDELIAEARKPDNPCHGDFEWDIERGMQLLWRQQARDLIRQVHVETDVITGTTKVPYYVAAPDFKHDRSRYMKLLSARGKHEQADAIMSDEMGRITAAAQRAKVVAGVLGYKVEAQMNVIIKAAVNIKTEIERRRAAATAPRVRGRPAAVGRKKAHPSRRRKDSGEARA